MPWDKLESIEQINTIVEASKERPQIIYKHSTRCHTCTDIKADLQMKLSELKKNADLLFLDLLRYREVSNEIARRFGVIHQSPQILIIQNGSVIYDADHRNIRPEILLNKISAEKI